MKNIQYTIVSLLVTDVVLTNRVIITKININ